MNPRSRPHLGPSKARWIARLGEGGHRLVTLGPILGQSPQQCKSLPPPTWTSPVRPLGGEEFGTPDMETGWSNNVGLLAVGVFQQGQPSAAARIVLNRLD